MVPLLLHLFFAIFYILNLIHKLSQNYRTLALIETFGYKGQIISTKQLDQKQLRHEVNMSTMKHNYK